MRQTRRRLKNSPRLHLSGQLHRRAGLHNLAHRLGEPRGELHERLTANLIRVNAVLIHRQVGVKLAATLPQGACGRVHQGRGERSRLITEQRRGCRHAQVAHENAGEQAAVAVAVRDEDAAARTGEELHLFGHVLDDADDEALGAFCGVHLAGHTGCGEAQQGAQGGSLVVGEFAALVLVLVAAHVHAVNIERTFCIPESFVHPVHQRCGSLRVARTHIRQSSRRGRRSIHKITLGLAPTHATHRGETLRQLLKEGRASILGGNIIRAGQLNAEGVHAAHREGQPRHIVKVVVREAAIVAHVNAAQQRAGTVQLLLGGSNIAFAQVTLTGINHTVQQVRLPPVVPSVQALAQRARVGHLHRTNEGAGNAKNTVHEGVGDAGGCGSGMRGGALGVLANRLQRLRVVGRRLGIHGPSVVAVKYYV